MKPHSLKAILAVGALFASAATAATITVNSTADLPDITPGNGVCATGRLTPTGAPECTLRAAVDEANALAGADAISVPAGIYNLSSSTLCHYKDRGNPNLLTTTSRTLCIAGDTAITGAGAALTIIDGLAVERIFFISDGAAVTLDSLTVQNGRHTGASFDGRGAGINNQGTLTILNCSISGNSADGAGGGIHTAGSLTILGGSISNNSGADDGGGIWLFSGTLSISGSTFDGNAAKNGGGAIALYNGTASITGSAFINNTADSGGALRVFNSSVLNVTNSTFPGNATTNTGGAIRNDSGTVYLNNVTVVRNRSSVYGGGGVSGGMHLRNSILAANSIVNLQFFPGADCLVLAPDSIISEGYNLIQDSRNCNITGDTASNVLGQDAQLGALSLNGGSTQTVSLLATSPAVDTGSPAAPGSGGFACSAYDQRGILRPQSSRCDIGAFERNGAFAVSKITPARGGNTGSTMVIVSGAGFAAGASVRLNRAGNPVIIGSPVNVELGGFSLATSLDLTGALPGAWDLVVNNADGGSVTLPAAFVVEAPRAPDIFSYIVGRSALRPGVPARFTIVYGNRGNVDAFAIPLTLSTPGGFETSIFFPVAPPPPQAGQVPTDWSLDLLSVFPYSLSTRQTVPLMIPIVPAGFTGAIDFSLYLPPTLSHGDTFTFEVTLGDSIANPASLQRMVDGAVAYAKASLGVTVPATSLASLRAYISNQVALTAPAGRDQLVSTLGTGTLVYSLAEMVIDAARYAASQTPVLSAKSKLAPAAGGSSGGGSNCNGGMIVEGSSGCKDPGFKLPPPAEPGKPNPNGITPAGCYALADHHVSRDGNSCVPDTGPSCPINTGIPSAACRPIPILHSVDPNEKSGPGGGANGAAQTSTTPLGYAISFENQPSATGAAQQVVVTDQLDATKVDLSTFSLGPMNFGSFTVVPPSGQTSYLKILDMRPDQNFLVKIDAKLNPATGLVSWRFSTLDPNGQITTDPVLGFLPPNTSPPNGDGHVVFTIQPKRPIATGTRVCNLASVVFDFNSPILTNQWCNTMDDVAPVSRVQALPPQSSSTFTVQWSGTDTGSTVSNFDIYLSDNGAPFVKWLDYSQLTQSPYTGVSGHTYGFFSIARDEAGNVEAGKTMAEASTSIASSCAADVTSQYTIVRGGFRFDNASGHYVQTVTATTKGNTPAPQGLRFVLDGLTPGVTLANSAGLTSCAAPLASPYASFSPATPTGPAVSGVLQFSNPANTAIAYNLRLLAPGIQP